MNYEEKYKEALEDMRVIYPNLKGDAKLAVEHAFPELAESEDERIRKAIIEHFKQSETEFPGLTFGGYYYSDVLAYLEKQKEQKPADLYEMMVHKEPYIAPVPTPMVADEQKPVDYEAELRKCKDNPLYFYDKYVSIKQKPAEWSDEDEKYLNRVINLWVNDFGEDSDTVKWLKSLRPSWKPSEEQMHGLAHAINLDVYDAKRYGLDSLYSDLKKLM